MINFYKFLKILNENRERKPGWPMTGHAQDRYGKFKDWLNNNKQFVSVKKGYGQCDDCLHVMYHDGADMWGLSHLEDYTVTSHVSGPAVVLMPREIENENENHQPDIEQYKTQIRSYLPKYIRLAFRKIDLDTPRSLNELIEKLISRYSWEIKDGHQRGNNAEGMAEDIAHDYAADVGYK